MKKLTVVPRPATQQQSHAEQIPPPPPSDRVRLPMLAFGPGDRKEDCENHSGCLTRWLKVSDRKLPPEVLKLPRRQRQSAHCPSDCQSYQPEDANERIANAMRPR